MEVAEKQPVVMVDPFDFAGQATPPAAKEVVKEAAPEEPVTEAGANATTPDPVVPEPAKADAPVAEDDDVAAAIAALDTPAAGEVAWTDEAKQTFAKYFGADDPATFKKEFTTLREQYELVNQEREALTALKKDIESLTPAMLRAIELQREGKDPVAYLKSLPDGVIHNKPASELTDRQLIETYAKGKVSDEQWEKLNDPDTDSEVVEAIKEKIAMYRDIAVEKHEAERGRISQEYEAGIKAQQQAFEQYQKGVASAIAHAKNDPFAKAFVNKGHVDEFQKPGAFLSRFLESDGVTPKPEALAMVIKAERFDAAVKASKTAGYKKGYEDGLAEDTSARPATPSARRAVAEQPKPQDKTTEDAKLLDRITGTAV